VDLFYEGRKAN